MALIDRKITTYAKDITTLSDNPNNDGLSATDLKAWFMGAVKEEVKTTANGIIDDLTATTDGASGADQIGATAIKSGGATKVQGQLEEIYADTAHLTGDQTIAGVKTFSYSPVVPTPSTDYQASTKKYVDDVGNTKLTADNITQTITGANRTDKVISEAAYNSKQIEIGAADMLQSTYDTQGKHADAFNAANHTYNNSTSGLTATNTQAAIDETNTKINSVSTNITTEIEKLKINALLTDLQLSANSSNIDAWCDTLIDTSLLNLSSCIDVGIESGKLKILPHYNYYTYTTTRLIGYNTTSWAYGQTFVTPDKACSVLKLVVSLSKTGSPSDNLTASIYATSGGLPTGNALATSATISGSTLSTSYTDCTFTFANMVSLSANTTYAIVIKRSNTADSSNYYSIRVSSTSTYSGGASLNGYSSGYWEIDTGYDLAFKIYLNDGIAYWNAVTSSEILSKMAIVATQNVGTGTISWYLSNDGTTWVTISNLKQMYTTSFTTTSVYLKCVLTGNAEVDAVAYGG